MTRFNHNPRITDAVTYMLIDGNNTTQLKQHGIKSMTVQRTTDADIGSAIMLRIVHEQCQFLTLCNNSILMNLAKLNHTNMSV